MVKSARNCKNVQTLETIEFTVIIIMVTQNKPLIACSI